MSYWAKTYGEGEAHGVAVDKNGDIIIVGQTKDENAFVARLNKGGDVKWFKIYGGSKQDSFNDVKIAPNGDIIVAGYTKSFGVGIWNAWVLKLDKNGNVKWQKTYGGKSWDGALAVGIAPNGDIIVAGYTYSFGASSVDLSKNGHDLLKKFAHGGDFWVLRLDENGNVKWQKTYGGSDYDGAHSVAIANNGDIIVAGGTSSFSASKVDVWVLRLDSKGNVKWQKTYGGSDYDSASAVAITDDGGIIVAGHTESFGAGGKDVWVLRLDENGNVKWQKTYGGTKDDEANAVAIASNGDIIVAGGTWSFGTDKENAWILRLDENGNVKWQKTCGGSDEDDAHAVAITPNGNIIVAGWTGSFGGVWVLRLPPDGNLPDCDFCGDSHAQVTDTNAEVRDTNCEVLSGIRKYQVEVGLIRKKKKWRIEKATPTVKGSHARIKTLQIKPETQYYHPLQEDAIEPSTSKAKNIKLNKTVHVASFPKVSVELRSIPYVYVEGLNYPIKLTGPGGKTLKDRTLYDMEFKEKIGQAVLKLINNDTFRELIERLVNKYGEITELDINFAPSNLKFNGFSALLKQPFGQVYKWNVNLKLGSIILRPKKGNQVLYREPLTPNEIQELKNASRELMELMDIAKNSETTTTKITPQPTHQKSAIPQNSATSITPATPVTPSSVSSYVSVTSFPAELLQFYEPLEELGKGGFAKVYKARRKRDGEIVALKIPLSLDAATGKSFLREIENWTKLKHPNIVRVYDYNILPVPFFEMEYCEGSLAQLPKPLPPRDAALLIFNIAEGLEYAHSKGIIHRDLKPSNILLKGGIPKVSDWGLSKVIGESRSTTTTSFTALYAAPEQFSKSRFGPTDQRTDIWQLGIIFYELVTGRLPFDSEDPFELMSMIMMEDPVPPSEVNPEAKEVEPVILRMLAKHKEERYEDVGELQMDLAGYLGIEFRRELRKSRTMGDKRLIIYYLSNLLLMSVKTGNLTGAYKYSEDFAKFIGGKLGNEFSSLAEQFKLRLEERLDIPVELLEKTEILVHRVMVDYK
ncbi:hypothetical protein A3L09_07205 [Thermococcus profundus]|uniref:Protein kinase domain-containing protein n=1 Tax=Thermococcus profundus TaxID=49899 RepID=A0A2Z2MB84_THEPR|nr:protein kinase [Thermococcus profundus]ASJ03056.1 hypothetical protein A3L09_07205 [Thermococcus profundus]